MKKEIMTSCFRITFCSLMIITCAWNLRITIARSLQRADLPVRWRGRWTALVRPPLGKCPRRQKVLGWNWHGHHLEKLVKKVSARFGLTAGARRHAATILQDGSISCPKSKRSTLDLTILYGLIHQSGPVDVWMRDASTCLRPTTPENTKIILRYCVSTYYPENMTNPDLHIQDLGFSVQAYYAPPNPSFK